MTVVADAAPLIFLSKLNRLDLISILYPGRLLIPKRVAKELLAGSGDFQEKIRSVIHPVQISMATTTAKAIR